VRNGHDLVESNAVKVKMLKPARPGRTA